MTLSNDDLDTNSLLVRANAMEERLRLSEASSGVGSFELDLASRVWDLGPQTEILLGIDGQNADRLSAAWKQAIFPDDLTKIDAAIEAAVQTASFYVEFRVRYADGSLHWIAGRGHVTADTLPSTPVLRGSFYEVTERKSLEAKLLAVNETLEARVAELREEAHALEVLNRTCTAVAAEHDLERLVQMVTDAGVELTHASFGAFFYNVLRDDGEAYTLYTLSGAPREAFSKFPMPRNTAVFDPTFRGEGVIRSDDILADPRYGKSAPYHGMPEGHLPVRSYLAVPVISRTSDVLGGLFFGHPEPAVFTPRAERIVVALAAQAAVAIDNARLHQANRW
ncbi:MAG: multi-sensor hybrid histidine kinase [Rhodospirillales bacterium]|nr:multi-sensor hybrid histidine kinase [Rhodospirillales bacterium]